ncbi:MAG: hypothetical protein WCD35_17760, partial [Mycobacteriales bacterium]
MTSVPTPAANGGRRALAALLGYLAAAALVTAPILRDPVHSTLGGGGGDLALFLWFLSHTHAALWHDHGAGLLVTHALNAPDGVNLMWNTSLLLPGALLSPVTELGGPVLTLNVLFVLGPALSAWSAYLCSGRFLQRTSARLVTGLVFGFSPPLMAASLGHLHLTLLPLVPPLLLLVTDAATGRGRPVRTGLLAGLLVACQLLVGEEVLVLTAGAAVLLLAVLAVQHRQLVRRRLRAVLVTGLTAAATTLVLAGVPLWVQFFGTPRLHSELQSRDQFVLDPVQMVLPTSRVWLSPAGLRTLLPVWHLNASENMGYLGLPLLVLLVAVVWRWRRDPVVRTAAATAVGLVVLALGYHLHLAGVRTAVPTPWALSRSLPVVGSALTIRWMLVVTLLVALLVGIAVDRLPAGGRQRALGWVLVVLCLLPLVPRQFGEGSKVAAPAFFTGSAGALRGTTLLVPLPRPEIARAMAWHAQTQERSPIVEGYFLGPQRDDKTGFGTYPRRPTARILLSLVASGRSVDVSPTLRLHA